MNKKTERPGIFLITALVFLIPLLLLWGIVLKITWGWFIVPVFDVPSLSLAAAIGLSFVKSALMHSSAAQTNGWESLTGSIITPPIILFLAWILHQGWPL